MKILRAALLLSVGLLFGVAASAQAQIGAWWYVPDYTYYPNYYGTGPVIVPHSLNYYWPGYVGPGIAAAGPGWYPGYYPSVEGLYYGQAELAEGLGRYNLMTGEAATRLAEARRLNAQARAEEVRNYWEARRMREGFLREQRAQRRAARQAPAVRGPALPAAEEFDPATGAIHWPPVLRDDRFAAFRQEIEQLFTDRAVTRQGGQGTLNYLQLRSAIARLREQLEAAAGQLPAADVAAANRFLARLLNEAREAPEAAPAAVEGQAQAPPG